MVSGDLSISAHARAVLRLGLPLIGSHLAQFAVVIIDTVMLGWYGVDALAAVTLGGAAFSLFLLVGSGFAWAVMPVVAGAAAAGRQRQVRRVTRMAMWLSALAAGFGVATFMFAELLFLALGQEAGVARDAARYLGIAGWGLFPALQVMVLKSYLSALERTRVLLVVTILAAVLNGALNYALIFGNWGAPEMGLRGAAIASVIMHAASFAALALHAAFSTPEHALFRRLWFPDREAFARIFALGWPIGLTTLSETGLFSAVAVMMGWIGTVELAAHGVALQLAALTFLVQVGLSQVATIRAGQALGRGDAAGLRRGALAVIAIGAIFALAAVALFLSIPERLIALFLDPGDPRRAQVIEVGAQLLAVAALFQLADGGQVLALGLLRGVQDTRVPMLIAALAYWPLGLGAAWLLGFALGLGHVGVWLGLVVGLGTAAVLMMVRFWRREDGWLAAGARVGG